MSEQLQKSGPGMRANSPEAFAGRVDFVVVVVVVVVHNDQRHLNAYTVTMRSPVRPLPCVRTRFRRRHPSGSNH